MSGDYAKREIMTGGDKSASSGRTHSRESDHKHKEESASSIKSQRRGDKKKKMKKVVYYETDSSSPSTSTFESTSVTSKRHERKKYSKMSLRYLICSFFFTYNEQIRNALKFVVTDFASNFFVSYIDSRTHALLVIDPFCQGKPALYQ